MKVKKILISIVILMIGVFSILTLSSCSKKLDKYSDYISELRTNVYLGETEHFNISVITGIRENPYVLDGHCNGTKDFTVITIEPKEYDASASYGYKAVINGIEYSGDMLPHPFGKSYSADIDKQSIADTVLCTIIVNGVNEETELKSIVTADMINAEKAFEIALKRLDKSLDSLHINGRLNAEIYIRLMENPIDNTGGYKWYIAFIGDSQILYACLIDPITMDILAVRD